MRSPPNVLHASLRTFSAIGVTVGMTSLALTVLRPLAVASTVLAFGFALLKLKTALQRRRQ
jgi:hypothetical protein